ncbi:MAG TPA: PAS domain-containing protein [Stellaceae bacterium]
MSLEQVHARRLDIVDPLLQPLYDYWSGKCGGRAMPSRSDIDPVDLSFMLGQILLIDVLRAPRRFRVRVHGTELVRRAGYELTGKTLDALPLPEYRAIAQRSLTTVVETCAPFHSVRDRVVDGRSFRYEGLVLPLSRNERDVDMLLVGMRYSE